MPKWEYRLFDSKSLEGGGAFKGKSRETAEAYLNALGADGWEIVAVSFREISKGFEFSGLAKRAEPLPTNAE